MPNGGGGKHLSHGSEYRCSGATNGNLSHIHNCSIMSKLDISCALICDVQHNSLYIQAKQALPQL